MFSAFAMIFQIRSLKFSSKWSSPAWPSEKWSFESGWSSETWSETHGFSFSGPLGLVVGGVLLQVDAGGSFQCSHLCGSLEESPGQAGEPRQGGQV